MMDGPTDFCGLSSGKVLGCAPHVKSMRHQRARIVFVGCCAFFFFGTFVHTAQSQTSVRKAADSPATARPPATVRSFVSEHCAGCHDADTKKGNLDLEPLASAEMTEHADVWEKVVRRLRARQMPPADKKHPDENTYKAILSVLEGSLDSAYAKHPQPGRTDTVRRLNRTEYQNAIRDLLAVDIDATALLPKEEAGHGFDNVTVGNLSPTLLDRYISAAQKISRLAIGAPSRVGGDTFRLPPDRTQEEHVAGLPPGTRGGTLIPYTFSQDAEYEIQIRLTRDRNEEVEGLREPHQLELLLDREPVRSFTVAPPKDRDFEKVDQHLKIRLPVKAGFHHVGVTFAKNPSVLLETRREPYNARFNMHRHPRLTPAIYQVSITGPYAANGPGETESRRRIFIATPTKPQEEEACAKQILSNLVRRAYRRPVTDADLVKTMAIYRKGRGEGNFEAGIETALSAILVSPNFLFRVEEDAAGVPPGTAYRISDLELASRLSFFLWSSIPDEELLNAAIRGELSQSSILEKQTRRMLAHPRSKSLANNFAEQWLYLRNLESFTPDLRLFPDFDDNLRQAFRQETQLFFESVLREDLSAMTIAQGGLHLSQRAVGSALPDSPCLRESVPARVA